MRTLGLFALAFGAACGGGGQPAPSCKLDGAVPIEHPTSPTGSETWASGIHHVPTTLTVPVGATLTIAACVQVQLDSDVDLLVNGTLVASGTQAQPIHFQPTTAGTPWGSIHLSPSGSAQLAYTTLSGGGGSAPVATSGTLGAPLYAQGTGSPPPAVLAVDHVTVQQATGVGVALVNAGFASGSTSLTVTQAGDAAVYLGADVVDSLPDGTYTGNARDVIALQTAYFASQNNERAITRDLTFHARGVPYCVGLYDSGEIRIGSPGVAAPLVTIEAGVTLGFTKGTSVTGRIDVQGDTAQNPTAALGALSAVGTAAAPIVFGSCEATPAPGDWIGLQFTGVDSRTALSNVQILYAGANSGVVGVCDTNSGAGGTSTKDGDAALQIFFQQGAPAASFLSSSTITQSASSGIYRGWQAQNVDFLAGNSVSGVSWCTQTLVPDALNACTGSCPTG